MIWNKIDTRNLVYSNGNWDSVKSSVRCKTFGVMVELAEGKIESYRSDLYHDALWINEIVNGPMSFDWIVRDGGTFIGETVQHVKIEEWPGTVKYRFEILNDDGKWQLGVYQADEDDYKLPKEFEPYFNNELPTDIDYSENEAYQLAAEDPLDVSCTGYKGIYGIQHESDTCPVHHDIPKEAQTSVPEKPAIKFEMTTEENKKEILDFLFNPPRPAIFPTPRNEVTQRKVNNMYDLINDLREKLESAQSSRDELQEAKYDIDSAIDDLDTYISDLDDLIGQLDSLPEVSVSVSVDVDFES